MVPVEPFRSTCATQTKSRRCRPASRKQLGALDVLVNNAGIEIQGDVLETEPEAWDEVFAVNLRGTYLASRALLPLLLRQAADDRAGSDRQQRIA